MSDRRFFAVVLTFDQLAEVLDLPEGLKVIKVEEPSGYVQLIAITVEGAGHFTRNGRPFNVTLDELEKFLLKETPEEKDDSPNC